MNENTIEIFKKREFGEFISTPITFFVQEFKLLAKSLLFFVGPFIVLELVLINYFHLGYSQDFMDMFTEEGLAGNQRGNSIIRLVELFQSVMLYSTMGVYVKLYVERGKGKFDTPDIWKGIRKFYWPVLGGQVLAGLMIVIGFLLIIIPGIYLAVVMSVLFVIIIFEEEGVGKAISRTFEIFKGNWWTAFGTFIVMGLMFFIIIALFGAIIGLIFSMFGYGQIISAFSDAIIGFVTILITAILALLPVFLYTSFVTDKENPGLMDRINKISDDNDDVNIFEVKEQDDSQNTDDDSLVKKEEEPKTEDDWGKLLDDQEKKNRFEGEEDDKENDRFKPKF